MSTLCQGYVKGGGPCQHWLPHFDVKHLFHILLTKSETMSTLCQGSRSMSTLCQGYVKGGGPCRRWLPVFDVKHIFYIFF